MPHINQVVKNQNPELPRLKVTAAEIMAEKRAHILRNLLYTPEEAGQVLGKSPRTILELVKDGKLVAADESAKGRKLSCGYRITAESVESYRQSILVPSDFFGK